MSKRVASGEWLVASGRWTAVFLFLLAFALMMGSALRKSATVDEQSHLFRGAAYLEAGATHFLLGHPLLGSAISALPLLTEPDLRLPLDDPAWEAGNWSLAGDAFLWRINENPQRLLFLGRLPVIWLTLLLGALLFRWGRELAGPYAGALALALFLLDPNVLANGRLITGDLPLTLFFTLTVYGLWRWDVGKAGGLALAGLGLGLAGATKFNAALLVPILGMIGLWLAWRRRGRPSAAVWRPVTAVIAIGLLGWLVIWAAYGFHLWRGFLPGGAFWDDLFWELRYFDKPHGAYLFGRYGTAGWWYYFPAAFFLKTPLLTLGLLMAALGRQVFLALRRQPSSAAPLFLLLPPLIYFAASMGSSLNIGYRYLLPALPFLFLFTAVTLIRWRRKNSSFIIRYSSFLVVVWLAVTAVSIWPDYIPYFNLLAGGRGWQMLSDSNVDWGQDLPALTDWQRQTGQRLKLSYFGTARPSAYGVDFEPLPTWPPAPEQANPVYQAYNPADPAPGWYAISVTNLHGIVLGEARDAFAWFREREPAAKIGGSIFVYEVPVSGPPADVVFAGLRPADLPPALHEGLGTNDVRPRWFEAESGFIWPSGGGWLAAPSGFAPPPALASFWPDGGAVAGTAVLYPLSPPPDLDWETAVPRDFGGILAFRGWQALPGETGTMRLLTVWDVDEGTELSLKLFIHVLDADGQLLGQWDGLRVRPQSLASGDRFIHLHEIGIGETHPASLLIGVYDGETLERLGEPVSVPLAAGG